jgi:tetratricopeptide (TPR) repeat protein
MAHLFRGRALWGLGEREEGIASLRRAVDLAGHMADPHLHLGEALAEMGKTEEGLAHLRQAVRLAPPHDPAPRQALERWVDKQK